MRCCGSRKTGGSPGSLSDRDWGEIPRLRAQYSVQRELASSGFAQVDEMLRLRAQNEKVEGTRLPDNCALTNHSG